MSDGDLWRDRNKVFVAGLPPHVDDNALYEKFKMFGEMHQSKVVYDQKTGRSKGFGFVTFCEYVHALEAVDNLNQSKWENRVLNVRFLQPKNGTAIGSAGGGPPMTSNKPTKVIGPRPEGCTTIYVGNLAYDITEDVLRKVFEKCGTVKAIRFAEHIQTKEFRGFGYVQFYEEAPCEAAVKLDGMIVMGRPMNIDYGSRDEASAKAREDLTKKLKKGICNKFQTGECDRGDDCKFAHVLKDQDAELLIQPADRPVGAASYTAAAAAPAPLNNANSDAPVCINFQKGKCKRGDACKFQHLGAVAVAAAAAQASVPVVSPTSVRAPRQEDVYAKTPSHNEEEEEEEATSADADAPVCQNFQKGKCKRGSACRFRHVAAAKESAASYKRSSANQWTVPARVERPAAIVADVAVCQNFRRGRCNRGASCRFAHTGHEQAAAADVVEEVSFYQKRFQSICYNWQKSASCARGDNCPFQHEGGPEPAGNVAHGGEAEEEEAPEQQEDDADASSVAKKKKKEKKKEKKIKKRKASESGGEDDEKVKKDKKKRKKKDRSED
ncbi:Rna binding protein, partial [Globisporangium splendens]